MRKKSPFAVLVALVFAMALASSALVAGAAGPASKDYEKKMQPPPQSPANPDVKARMDGRNNPGQPPASAPQTVKPVSPPSRPPAPAQVTGQNAKQPATSAQDPKKSATFVNKVNTAPGTTSSAKKPEAGYNATKELLGR